MIWMDCTTHNLGNWFLTAIAWVESEDEEKGFSWYLHKSSSHDTAAVAGSMDHLII
jgi:hypothetical protein